MDWYILGFCFLIALPVVFLWRMLERAGDRKLLNKLVADAKLGKLPKTSLEDPKNGIISVSEHGFTIHRGEKLFAEVGWDEVEEIRAYKRGGITDLICWGFCRANDKYLVEVNEEMAGFNNLQEAVKARYGVTLDDWWSEVAFPAFATNMMVIWPKKDDTQPCHPADAKDRAADG